jgi:hypothetical protein
VIFIRIGQVHDPFQDCCVVFTIVFIAAALASVCIPGGKAQKS